MWECPDYFKLDGAHVISFSPQGLSEEECRFQNIYQSGYVIDDRSPVKELSDNEGKMTVDEDTFTEWDMGFDFYAPQTFLDEGGRRIIVGWAGMPDADYTNGEVDTENWQHCFTVPRKLVINAGIDGRKRVFQTPIEELEALRTGEVITLKTSADDQTVYNSDSGLMDIVCDNLSGKFSVVISEGVGFSFDGGQAVLSLSEVNGRGRKERKAKITEINSLRILVDSSIIEYYINDGEMVFTTRFFKNKKSVDVAFNMVNADITVYTMSRNKVITE